nr:MAG TPA: hypothetical protein [Caudoviricetes sp.]
MIVATLEKLTFSSLFVLYFSVSALFKSYFTLFFIVCTDF